MKRQLYRGKIAQRLFCCTALPLLALVACTNHGSGSKAKEAWNQENDPINLSGDFGRTLSELPLQGSLARTPWSDTYWPSNQGGISNRWRVADDSDMFNYDSPTLANLKTMSAAQLADLSPAEKYDIYEGNYQYPTVASERERTSADNADWEGICHGWAPAALNFSKPKPVALTNRDGISIPFGEADIKALLDYYQGEASDGPSIMLGMRCDVDVKKYRSPATLLKEHPECKGINPGAFHVAVTNLLGLQKQGFVVDAAHGDQIWNQPVYKFKSKIVRTQKPSASAAADAVSEAVVHTELTYTVEIDPVWKSGAASLKTESYDYTVELDDQGAIIGGAWIGVPKTDFIWTQEVPSFAGYYRDIKKIEEASLAGRELAEPK